jgi:hypothetical protein
MINFPSSPTNGQQLVVGNMLYTYSSVVGAWNGSKQATARPYNYVVNPSFQISQQNAGTAGTVSAYFFADQWQQSASLPQTVQRIGGGATPNGSPFYAILVVSVPKASLAATGEYTSIIQALEGYRMSPFWWGYTLAKPCVLRFWTSAPAGTYSVGFRSVVNTPTNYRGCHQLYTISPAQAGTWQEIVLPFPPEIDNYPTNVSTWAKTGANMVYLWFSWAASAAYLTPPGAWASGNFIGATGISNGIATVGLSYSIADVGLYYDPDNTGRAPPWEPVSEAVALSESQRYWYKSVHSRGFVASATAPNRMGCVHPVQMRATPALTAVGSTVYDVSTNNAMAMSTFTSNLDALEYSGTGSGLTVGRACVHLGNVSTNYVAVSAR